MSTWRRITSDAWSIQWMSSSTTTIGAAFVMSVAIAWLSTDMRVAASSSTAFDAVVGMRRRSAGMIAANSWASSGSSASSCSVDSVSTSGVSASVHGRYPTARSSSQRPRSTAAPASCIAWVSSLVSRVLPIPGSPATSRPRHSSRFQPSSNSATNEARSGERTTPCTGQRGRELGSRCRIGRSFRRAVPSDTHDPHRCADPLERVVAERLHRVLVPTPHQHPHDLGGKDLVGCGSTAQCGPTSTTGMPL